MTTLNRLRGYPIFWKISILTFWNSLPVNFELIGLAAVTGQQGPGTVCLYHPCTGVTGACLYAWLMWIQGDEVQALTLAQPSLCWPMQLPGFWCPIHKARITFISIPLPRPHLPARASPSSLSQTQRFFLMSIFSIQIWKRNRHLGCCRSYRHWLTFNTL